MIYKRLFVSCVSPATRRGHCTAASTLDQHLTAPPFAALYTKLGFLSTTLLFDTTAATTDVTAA